MKTILITKEDDSSCRDMRVLADELRELGSDVFEYNWDDIEAQPLIALYDIYNTPCVLITTDEGTYINMWQGEMPSFSEVRYRGGDA